MKVKVEKCPYCGGAKFGEGYQSYHARMQSKDNIFKTSPIFYTICMNCGSIVHSYVEKPDRFKRGK